MTKKSTPIMQPGTGPVSIGYDWGNTGKRRTKTFDDAHAAKLFYVKKDKDGRSPEVVTTDAPEATKTDAATRPTANESTPDNTAPFGLKPGSKSARVASVLTAKPKRMKQIMEEAGVDQTFYNLMKRLVLAGHVAKTNDGYARAN